MSQKKERPFGRSEAVEKLCFSNSLSIETTLSIEFATPNRALRAQFGVVLYKNRDTCSRFLWKLRLAAISYFMRAAREGLFRQAESGRLAALFFFEIIKTQGMCPGLIRATRKTVQEQEKLLQSIVFCSSFILLREQFILME